MAISPALSMTHAKTRLPNHRHPAVRAVMGLYLTAGERKPLHDKWVPFTHIINPERHALPLESFASQNCYDNMHIVTCYSIFC